MRFHPKRGHMIDFIFPITLFCVFALSALTLILLAARIYQNTTENSSLQYSARTALAYISEKIHQNDDRGSVYPENIDGYDAIVIEQTDGAETLRTYIYSYEQNLKELSIRDDGDFSAADGRTILAIQNFSMEQISDNLFKFNCTDVKNNASSTIVGIRSN